MQTERKNLKLTDVESLSKDLENNSNGVKEAELFFSQYSMNHVLKKYANLSDDYKIHALLEHGVMLTDNVEGAFRVHEYLPSITSSQYRVNVLKKQKNYHGAYAIGPFIHYANPLITGNDFNVEKERLGRNLLVFPSHSIEGIISQFDYEGFCNEIKNFSQNFDSVRICLFYKDVQLEKHKIYQKYGFEVVTAGHVYDFNFLPRLKSIIELSDMTMSNEIGTHLGYCIYLNKPHYLDLSQKIKRSLENNEKSSNRTANITKHSWDKENKSDNVAQIKNLFSNYEERITNDQFDVISYLWGFDEVKSPVELKKIFHNINKDFSWIKYYISCFSRLKTMLKGGL